MKHKKGLISDSLPYIEKKEVEEDYVSPIIRSVNSTVRNSGYRQ